MQYDFDKITSRKNTCCLKWDNTEKIFKGQDVLPMWIADMDFQVPPSVTEAIECRNKHGIFGYSEGLSPSFCDSILSWVHKRHNWKINSEWLICTPGVVPALAISVLAFTNIGDKVLIQSPVYTPFYTVVKNNGRQLVESPLILKNDRYEMDFEDLELKMQSGIKLMILCSPHNPVGRVFNSTELEKLGNLCTKYDVLLVSDEIHADIVYKGSKHIPVASLSEKLSKNTITCIAASKTFSLAGLSTSTVIIPDDKKREQFKNRMHSLGLESGNIFGMVATEAAYRYGEEWLDQLLCYLENNILFLMDYFKEKIPKIRVIKPEGTYLVWLDCRKLGMNSEELSKFMVQTAKVRLNDGYRYGTGGAQFMRINIACPRSIILEGLKRIENAVNKL